jgi:hypothetical protein
MGLAAHNSGGQVRLGLSATVASAVLYSAVVLLGLGPASPSAQGREADRSTPVVRVPRDPAVSGPARRLPQVSPGPARRHAQHRPAAAQDEQVVVATADPIAQTDGGKSSPAPPRAPEAKPKTASAPASSPEPTTSGPADSGPSEPDPVLTVPELQTTVTVPVPGQPITVTVPQLPPVQLPPVPLPPTPTVSLP